MFYLASFYSGESNAQIRLGHDRMKGLYNRRLGDLLPNDRGSGQYSTISNHKIIRGIINPP